MAITAEQAFEELGYGEAEEHHGLPKLEYIAHHDPDLLQSIVDRCREIDGVEAQLWREWFRDYPSMYKIDDSDPHLDMVLMQYHLFPVAIKAADMVVKGSTVLVPTFVGSAWLFMERTGGEWDMGNAYTIVATFMRTSGTQEDPERKQKLEFVASHLAEVTELIPEIAKSDGTLATVTKMVHERFPHTVEPVSPVPNSDEG